MKTIKKLFLLFLATFVLAACSNDDDTAPDNPPVDPPTLNIVQTAQATDALSTLVSAVVRADLVDVLNGPGPFTVLAPTNDAFTAFLATNNDWSTIDDVPVDVLKNLLLNHVITGNVGATDLIGLGSGYSKTNAAGPDAGTLVDVYFTAAAPASVTFNGTSNVTQPDVAASNGTVHIVDAVVNSTLLAFATADSRFSNLAAAASDAGQELVFGAVQGASADEPITIFAPIDSAFQAVLDSDATWTTVTDIPDATLTGILLHHAISDSNVTSDELSDGTSVMMANFQNITLMLPSDQGNAATITSAGGTSSEVIIVDVQATNGVVHAIDTVLMPM